MKIFVDIDETICITIGPKNIARDYSKAEPIYENIKAVNKLYDEGHEITYWTARGQQSKKDYTSLTRQQLYNWNCKYTNVVMNHKPSYDLLICDKSKRIEEI